MPPSRLIALMSDFGLRDPFVGIMKGVILGINPSALVVDLCHEIEPGDTRGAAFALRTALPYFPESTIFVVVVDPGVGTKRRAIAVELDGRIVVAPDNGVLSWVLKGHPSQPAVELTNSKFFLSPVSATFHGRDIFAPVAAHLSNGVPLAEFGPAVDDLTTFPIPDVSVGAESLQGEVVYIDRFGNLVTNIGRQELEGWRRDLLAEEVNVRVASAEIGGIHESYGAAPLGHVVAVFGSAELLEIAVNQGNAADSLGVTVGSNVSVYRLAIRR